MHICDVRLRATQPTTVLFMLRDLAEVTLVNVFVEKVRRQQQSGSSSSNTASTTTSLGSHEIVRLSNVGDFVYLNNVVLADDDSDSDCEKPALLVVEQTPSLDILQSACTSNFWGSFHSSSALPRRRGCFELTGVQERLNVDDLRVSGHNTQSSLLQISLQASSATSCTIRLNRVQISQNRLELREADDDLAAILLVDSSSSSSSTTTTASQQLLLTVEVSDSAVTENVLLLLKNGDDTDDEEERKVTGRSAAGLFVQAPRACVTVRACRFHNNTSLKTWNALFLDAESVQLLQTSFSLGNYGYLAS